MGVYDFNLKGQSNYALNLILKKADDERFKDKVALTNASIEYRKGSWWGESAKTTIY